MARLRRRRHRKDRKSATAAILSPTSRKRRGRNGGKSKYSESEGRFLVTLASILAPIIAGAAFEAVKDNV